MVSDPNNMPISRSVRLLRGPGVCKIHGIWCLRYFFSAEESKVKVVVGLVLLEVLGSSTKNG